METGQPIRLATPDDAGAIAAIYAPHVSNGVASFELVPPAADEMGRRMEAILPTYPWLVCELDGRVAGYVYASQSRPRAAYRWCVDVTVYIDPSFHRRGVGATLYRTLFELLKLQGYYNAYAGITLPNTASVGLHEALGFRLVGVYRAIGCKFGCWHDVGWWSLDLQAKPAGEPPAPLDLAAARKLPEWRTALEAGAAHLKRG